MNGDQNIFRAEEAQAELICAVRLCQPAWENAGRLTFRSDGVPKSDWANWRARCFDPAFLPALERAFAASACGDRAALADADRELDRMLPVEAADWSRRAGHRLAEAHTAPGAEKLWKKYRERVLAEETPGHFAVMLAVRAAAFHLSPASLTAVFLFLEAKGGCPDGPLSEWTALIAAAMPRERPVRLRAA